MDFASQTAAYIQGTGPYGPRFLQTVGLPGPTDRLEINYFDYRDAVFVPLTPLGSMSFQTQLFSKEIGSDTVRNLKFPLTSDAAYLNYGIACDVDITLASTPETAPGTNPFGPQIISAVYKMLSATRIQMLVSNKLYLDSQIKWWANWQIPNILQPLDGQVASVPFAVSGASYGQHHRVYLELNPGIPFPANSSVQIIVYNNVPAYWSDLTNGGTVDLSVAPWNIQLSATMQFSFIGNQIRVTK